ncbi:TPA: MobA/MobL family protein [Pseudomonas aeruginosa]|uniref:MobA/MobL family protein n=1 Tax=Pseudomonas aeruginosa TaxID=287 RepID=UPI0022CE2E79|nr:MobA/MobL family protein [Pseudomonas aeruginosa]MBX6583425.1 MobA/MobL family protein [Pseudomonas aeruginosa]MBX6631784.1 MobA/MobL family protein [Pseudomonas aeruginosa]MCZ9831436.1 MobA/MobL family protein [Pseudomonas aeruginosa]HBO2152783.1 MobA/MobL family protein [Pseudomonas aeruginosa]HCI2696242.1 MobA/MobL family protein [Pseudomonas aeruginosa]
MAFLFEKRGALPGAEAKSRAERNMGQGMRMALKGETPSARARLNYITRQGEYSEGIDGPRVDLVATGSGNMPSWSSDADAFWHGVDQFERVNARRCVELELNLPPELTLDQQIQVVEVYAQRLLGAERLPYTWAIHDGGGKNPHCHLMFQERGLDGINRPDAQAWFKRANSKRPELGGAKKSRSITGAAWTMHARATWAESVNDGLRTAGHEPRYDHRSKAVQRDEAVRTGDLRRAASLDTLTERHEGAKIHGMRRRLERGEIELDDLPDYAQHLIEQNNRVRVYNNTLRDWARSATDAELYDYFVEELEEMNPAAHVTAYIAGQHQQAQVRVEKLRQQLAEPEPEVVGAALKLKADVERLAQELVDWRKAHPVRSWMAKDDEKSVREARQAYLASPELAKAKQARAERKQAREELSALESRLAKLEKAATAKPKSYEHGPLWDGYQQTWPARNAARERDWAAQKVREAERRARIKADYLQELAYIKADLDKSATERKAARSLAQMRRALESHALYQKIAVEREALKSKHRQPGRDGYKLYLLVLSNDGHAGALAELRRQQSQPKRLRAAGNAFSAENEPYPSASAVLSAVVYTVDLRGNVTYYSGEDRTQPILVDNGRLVQVLDQSQAAVETGLRLALQKFGPTLNVHGSPEFVAAVLGVVMRTGLRVQFKDRVLATELERLRTESIQTVQVPKVMPVRRKTEEEIEAEYAGEVYDQDDSREEVSELGLGDAEVTDTGMGEDDDDSGGPSRRVTKPPRLR